MADLLPSAGRPLAFGISGNPVVVVLHDWYGRLPWLEPYADGLARQGFRVVLPDLFDGVTTTDAAEARVLMEQLDLRASLVLIDDAIQIAKEHGSTRVGVVGFSMGGWLALLHAQGGSADAVVAYYASLGPQEQALIPCPVLLQLADIDEWPVGGEPEALVASLKDHGTPITQFTYLGTRHSFANADLPELLDSRAATVAFARTASFLTEHLTD